MPELDPLHNFRLDDRVAIVTGASSGLGERFARVLDAAGARLVLAARRMDRLEAVAGDLRDAHAVAVDLADDTAADRVISAALGHYGRVDVLVNNAGTHEIIPAVDETVAGFRRVVGVNLVAAFALASGCGRVMIEQGQGSVVNVASMLGLVGVGQVPMANYMASKGGLINLTRELAAQWARKGVRVNALAPGWFASEMTAEMFADAGSMKWMRGRAPMGRPGEPHELDGALLFLASDASSYMTGQTIVVDGGWTAV